MKAFNPIAIAVALFKIIRLTFPNFVLAKPNQRASKNAVEPKIKKVDVSWGIQLFAKLQMLDIIKLSNQEKLTSDTARRIFIRNNLGSFSSDNSSLDCSSTEVSKQLKTLLDGSIPILTKYLFFVIHSPLIEDFSFQTGTYSPWLFMRNWDAPY